MRISSRSRTRTTNQRGIALLSVLWLVAALTAIAFTVANVVRAETDRTATDSEALRAYYLASGAISRALLYIQWGPGYRNNDGSPMYFAPPMPVIHLAFPTGFAAVEVIPENSKLNVNTAAPGELKNLLVALGVEPARADPIVAAILDWRSGAPAPTEFDQYYLSLTPSFRARHASFQEIEELLLVRGVTPDLFYGSYTRAEDGKLVPHAALRDCLSAYASVAGTIDINTAEPAVMRAIGISPDAAAAIVRMRNAAPIRDMAQVAGLTGGNGRLGIVSNNSILTLRATARLKLPDGHLSEVQRSVSALVKILAPPWNPPFHIMRWYDNAATLQ